MVLNENKSFSTIIVPVLSRIETPFVFSEMALSCMSNIILSETLAKRDFVPNILFLLSCRIIHLVEG